MSEINQIKRQPGGGRKPKPRAKMPATAPATAANQDADTGLRAVIERLRQAEIEAAAEFNLARTTGDLGLVAAKKKDWLDFSEQLRKIEVSTPGVLSENQSTMPVEDAAAEFTRVATQFRIGLESLSRSLPPRIVGLDEAGIGDVLQASIIEVLEQLATDKW
jgi:hypothetical protein